MGQKTVWWQNAISTRTYTNNVNALIERIRYAYVRFGTYTHVKKKKLSQYTYACMHIGSLLRTHSVILSFVPLCPLLLPLYSPKQKVNREK